MSNALSLNHEIAVIGSGAMGAGIAQVAAVAGHRVLLFDLQLDVANKAIQRIQTEFEKQVKKGQLSVEAAKSASNRLHAVSAMTDLRNAKLVIEAIIENLDSKQKIFKELEHIVSDDCIFASNTSSISITSIGSTLLNPSRLVGMHFFNPVPKMHLVEIISGLTSNRSIVDCIYKTALEWGKYPVHAKSTPGFIVNRVARPFYSEALNMLNECIAEPTTIDAVMRESGGFRMGPFELMDLIGHDINFSVTQSVFHGYFCDPRFKPSIIQQELVNAGFLGKKSGHGFYEYGNEAKIPSPQTENHIFYEANDSDFITIYGNNIFSEFLIAQLKLAKVSFDYIEIGLEKEVIMQCGKTRLYLTDGRTATQRAHDESHNDTVLIDLTIDITKTKRIALTRADQCSDQAYQKILSILQLSGLTVSRFNDVSGMAVMRTVAMLANEAADTVNQGICSSKDVDLAMQKGVNYPLGPLAWANLIGIPYLTTVLENLALNYGEDRYRLSPLIRRKNANGGFFDV